MEPGQEEITEIVRATGATEQEARVLYHLEGASDAYQELPGLSWPNKLVFLAQFKPLMDSVAARIARREHPEYWPSPEEDENE